MSHHDPAGPSTLEQVLLCPGSLRMQLEEPNDGNEHSRLGTAAHTLGAWCLEDKQDAFQHIGRPINVEDNGANFIIVVDEEMAGAVQVYLDYVRNLPGDEILVEQRVNVPYVNTFGTADALKVARAERVLHVVDYKHGLGVFVNAQDNPQLKAYGLGAWDQMSIVDDFDIVEVAIVQPRADNIAAQRFTPDELVAWGKEIAPIVHQARTDPNAPRVPGPKQCKFCRAKAKCPELQSAVTETTGIEFPDLSSEHYESSLAGDPPEVMRGQELAAVLPKLDLVEDWCTAMRKAAHSHLTAGNPLPGYKLVEGRRGNREWTSSLAVEALLKERFRLPVDDMYDKTVIGPAAAERLLAKASPRRWKQLQALITQSSGRPTVVPDGDKRPAIGPPEPVKFDDLTNEDIA